MTLCLSVPGEDNLYASTSFFSDFFHRLFVPRLFNIIIDISRMISHSFIVLSALTQTALFQTISTL